VAITGDYAGLRDLQQRVAAIAEGKFVPELAQRMAAAGLKQLADQFKGSVDPYGEPWAPVVRKRARDTKAKARRAKSGRFVPTDRPLVDTGRLRAAATGAQANQSSGSLVRITIPVEYASFHQEGTARIKRRQILPEASTGGLGPRWSKAFEREALAMLRERTAR
jgi:hypothetical protein